MTKQKKITAAVALIAVIAIVIVSIFLMSGNAGGAANIQEIAIEELEPLSKEEGSALSGVCDHTISLGETDDLESLIEQDDTIVEKIEIDADNVDFEKAGEYEATYQITFDMEALNDWLDENERSVSFQTDTDPVIVKTTATITVQEETAKTSDGSKDTKKTDKKQTASDDKDAEGSNSSNSSSNSSSNTSGSSSGGSSSQSNHQHNWQAHTATRTVTKTVTVVDTPAQTVHGARFYTMQEDGTYIANGPTYWFENGFTTEDLKEIIRVGIKNADENGLYNGVDYRNYQNVKKEVPAVTHTEKQNVTETYTDYYYCSCGARKDA